MIANLNAEQTAALASLLANHDGPIRIEGGQGGERLVTFEREDVTYALDVDGEIQGAIPS